MVRNEFMTLGVDRETRGENKEEGVKKRYAR